MSDRAFRKVPARSKRLRYVVTCEHASAFVPQRYRWAFASVRAKRALLTHAGSDMGAVQIARIVASRLGAPLVVGQMSRLLMDLNRSPGHPNVFSDFSRQLDEADLAELMRLHADYRAQVEAHVRAASTPVCHLSIHSFTPIWEGQFRKTDVGLLFDPRRESEAAWAQTVQRRLRRACSLTIHRNAPYRGTADGLTTTLRSKFPQSRYSGIEVEFNQRLSISGQGQRMLADLFCQQLE